MDNLKPHMKTLGFGHRASRHMVLEQNGKLWITVSAEGASFFLDSASAAVGLLEIDLIDGGESVPYTYEAAVGSIGLKSAKGSAKIVIDTAANALRITGEGVSLRLDAKTAPGMATSINTPRGTELTIGSGRYLFQSRTGKISFDDTWLLTQFHSVTPVLNLAADGGKFDLVAYDVPADTEPLPVTKTPEECAAENEADFLEFCGTLVPVTAEWDDIRGVVAYRLWLGSRALSNGEPGIVNNKLVSSETDAWRQSLTSFAFADADKAVPLILNLPIEYPFVQGSAVLRLLESGLLKKTSRATVYQLYDALRAKVLWLQENRTLGGVFYYAYRFETGLPAPKIFAVGEPVASPDLYAYLITACEALAQLTDLTYNDGEASRWRTRAKELAHDLVSELWVDNTFVAKNLYTGETTPADALLANMTLTIGKLLPVHIAAPLGDGDFAGFGILAAFGLLRAGSTDKARKITEKLLKSARENGVTDTAYGAALLALAHETL